MWRYSGNKDLTRDFEEDLPQAQIDVQVKLVCEKAPPPDTVAPRILTVVSAKEKEERLKKVGMTDRRDDQEVETTFVVVGSEEATVPLAKRRRLVRVADKHDTGLSSAPPPTSPFKKFFADVVAIEKSKAAVAIEVLKHKAPKTKASFYYDDKTYLVSISHGFVKRLEKKTGRVLCLL